MFFFMFFFPVGVMADRHTLHDCLGSVRQDTFGIAPEVPVPKNTISVMVAIAVNKPVRKIKN